MLYRAHRDVYSQLPPESLSVSLNIMDQNENVPWRDQYIVDLDHGTIARRPTLSPSEMLLRCAVHLTGNGMDIATSSPERTRCRASAPTPSPRWPRSKWAMRAPRCWSAGWPTGMRGSGMIALDGWRFRLSGKPGFFVPLCEISVRHPWPRSSGPDRNSPARVIAPSSLLHAC